ncbi:MAG: NnrS family protein [Gammaproteobacteria bacterium]|nr:NnrS family protein [Gammaproteobacteria bacterium]
MPKGRKPIPRYRDHAGSIVLSQGFRPFFLLAGLWAALALVLSIGMIQGRIALPTAYDAVSWHFHEMLFGYVAATVTGFLLAAIPNWTGRLPLQAGHRLGHVLTAQNCEVCVLTCPYQFDRVGRFLAGHIDDVLYHHRLKTLAAHRFDIRVIFPRQRHVPVSDKRAAVADGKPGAGELAFGHRTVTCRRQ